MLLAPATQPRRTKRRDSGPVLLDVMYIPCLYNLKKIDELTIEELTIIDKIPQNVAISAHEWDFVESGGRCLFCSFDHLRKLDARKTPILVTARHRKRSCQLEQ